MKIRIGTRKSKLALIQANMIINEIKQHFPKIECKLRPVLTTGDKITNKNLYDIGGKALFLKELEEKLIQNEIDIAIHSLKDVPGILPEELSIVAVLKREDPRDCFVSLKYKSIEEMPYGGVIGSSSIRRRILIQQKRPDLKFVQFRGNINTRLEKLKNNKIDATILASAGLIRAGLFDTSYCYPISIEAMLPATGQGIIGMEIRNDNQAMQKLCKRINHQKTWYLAQAERGFLSYLGASCRTPLSAYAILNGNKIEAKYMLSDEDGIFIRFRNKTCPVRQYNDIGSKVAEELLRNSSFDQNNQLK